MHARMRNPLPKILYPAFLILAAATGRTQAHCDGLDGPVVTAARKALDSNQVERALAWVPATEEGALREAFRKAREVRKLGGEAQALADQYFFETLVRIHRAGEGAPYTGLKPAGRDLGPAIPAADAALRTGKLEPLEKLLTKDMEKGLKETFEAARKRSHFPPTDIARGRQYVTAYVEYIHFVERLHEAARRPAHGHFEEAAPEHAGHAGHE